MTVRSISQVPVCRTLKVTADRHLMIFEAFYWITRVLT